MVEGNYNSYLHKKSPNGKHAINPDGCTFFLSPTIPDEVSKLIDGLDHKKSSGPNGIPVFILKVFKEFFSFFHPRYMYVMYLLPYQGVLLLHSFHPRILLDSPPSASKSSPPQLLSS